jgi:hypothetical protein
VLRNENPSCPNASSTLFCEGSGATRTASRSLAISSALVAEGAYVVAGARHSSAELDALTEDGKAVAVSVDLGTVDGPPCPRC